MPTEVTRSNSIAEGKTKIIWPDLRNKTRVLIESKDDITAGDGVKHDLLEGKAVAATTTTCNVFRMIAQEGILPTHYIGQEDDRTFSAELATMIPIEVVVRRRVAGSFLKRNPGIEQGTILPNLVVEFFQKDDQAHDPLMVYSPERAEFQLYDASQPISEESRLGTVSRHRVTKQDLTDNDIKLMQIAAVLVFERLEKAWLKQHFALVDLKVEFGFDHLGRIILADVIDNDSWRIWYCGSPEGMLDKQVYRDLQATDPDVKAEAMARIAENYRKVAELTKAFVS